jgi:hypothetical protein
MGSSFVVESRVKTYRSIFVAVAFIALATTASLAQHHGGESASGSGRRGRSGSRH